MLLVIPLGLVGAIFFVTLRGLQNDVYLQVGLITTMGLSAKNAILMVEFAERAEREGKRVIDAAIEAARIRLRPILMTSFAFIFGVLPLALSTGAGANSRIAIGTAVDRRHAHRERCSRSFTFRCFSSSSAAAYAMGSRPSASACGAAGGAGMRRFAAALALLATSCASLEPDYVRPDPAIPPSWPVGDAYLRQAEAALPAVTYREIFHDPRLQTLIGQALINNRDLMVAAANIAAAREQYQIQRANQLPQLNAGAGRDRDAATRPTTCRRRLPGRPPGPELRARPVRPAALAHATSSSSAISRPRRRRARPGWPWSPTSPAPGSTYAADSSLLLIAEQTADSAEKSVRLTRAPARRRDRAANRPQPGRADPGAAQADLARQRTALAQDVKLLQLLVGAPIDPKLAARLDRRSVRQRIAELPAGLNSYVLLRRPDVLEAEYQLRAANAQIGAARAALFPRITLTGLLGFASSALTKIVHRRRVRLERRRRRDLHDLPGRSRPRQRPPDAKRSAHAALATYQKAIQTAFREVSDALARRGTIDDELGARQRQQAAAADVYVLSEAALQSRDRWLSRNAAIPSGPIIRPSRSWFKPSSPRRRTGSISMRRSAVTSLLQPPLPPG